MNSNRTLPCAACAAELADRLYVGTGAFSAQRVSLVCRACGHRNLFTSITANAGRWQVERAPTAPDAGASVGET